MANISQEQLAAPSASMTLSSFTNRYLMKRFLTILAFLTAMMRLVAAETDTLTVNTPPTPDVEEFQRDVESVVFIPKGQWITGVSVSYMQSNQDKYQFFIVENLSGDTYTFKVSPMLMFAIRNDLAVGGRLSYTRALTKLENADIVLDSETDYNIDHLYKLSHNYYGSILMRYYISLGHSKRFGLFNELQLQLGGGQAKLTTGTGSTLSGYYERNFQAEIGLAPGLCIFLNDYSALEVNVGLLGFKMTDTHTYSDQIYESERSSKSANFRINLFSISFGVTFYL